MQKERNNKTRNIILTIFGILIFCVIGTLAVIRDSNDVSQYIVRDNFTINNSGMYYGGEKAFTKTADVVVCRSTSAIDHLKKIFQCDVVCAWNDGSCQDEINNAIGTGNKNVLIRNGRYNLTDWIVVYSNTTILGESKYGTILENYMFNITEAHENLEIGHLSNIPHNNWSIYSLGEHRNLWLHDLYIEDTDSVAVDLVFLGKIANYSKNLLMENIDMYDVDLGINIYSNGYEYSNVIIQNINVYNLREDDCIAIIAHNGRTPTALPIVKDVKIDKITCIGNGSWLAGSVIKIDGGDAPSSDYGIIQDVFVSNVYAKKHSACIDIIKCRHCSVDMEDIKCYEMDQKGIWIQQYLDGKQTYKDIYIEDPFYGIWIQGDSTPANIKTNGGSIRFTDVYVKGNSSTNSLGLIETGGSRTQGTTNLYFDKVKLTNFNFGVYQLNDSNILPGGQQGNYTGNYYNLIFDTTISKARVNVSMEKSVLDFWHDSETYQQDQGYTDVARIITTNENYFPGYQYSGALPTCSTINPFSLRFASNSTSTCYCRGSWRCL